MPTVKLNQKSGQSLDQQIIVGRTAVPQSPGSFLRDFLIEQLCTQRDYCRTCPVGMDSQRQPVSVDQGHELGAIAQHHRPEEIAPLFRNGERAAEALRQ
jgi:hypothetical protein